MFTFLFRLFLFYTFHFVVGVTEDIGNIILVLKGVLSHNFQLVLTTQLNGVARHSLLEMSWKRLIDL